MAKEDLDQEENGTAKKGPGKFGVVLIVAMLIAIAVGLLKDDGDEPSTQDGESGFDPEQARLEEEQQRQRREELAERRDNPSVDDGSLDPFAAMSAMTRRQEMLEQQLDEVTGKLEEAQGSQEELSKLEKRYGQLEGQIRELTQMLMDDAENSRRRDRQNAAALNDEGDDLAFDLEGGLSESDISGENPNTSGEFALHPRPKPRSPYGENYIVLNGGGRNPITAGANPFGPSSSPQTQADGERLFGDGEGLEAPNPFGEENGNGSTTTAANASIESARPTGMTPEYESNVQAGYAGADRTERSQPASQARENSEPDPDTTINVPAFSFVEAETLHGLDCPIGAELPRSAEGNAGGVTPGAAQPMPVVLPLRGKIRGPNGNVVNLGTAHVMGWCIGRRVDRGESGRAMIKVESISYWDRHGEPQYLNSISGDVISLLDNHRGIQAPVDEVRRSYLGDQAGAAALAAAATQTNQAQFEETRNPNGGVDQVFNGNQGLAVGSKAASAAFSTIAELINQEARQAFDVVRVPSGAPVRVLFMAPFEVTNTKLEVEDEILDAYDVLI